MKRRPIEIIAEIGINHQGNMDIAEGLIKGAKNAGADVAKFQVRNQKARIDLDSEEKKKYKDIILKTELSQDQVVFLKETCDNNGIEFMASVSDVERVEWTEAIGMKRYKIASNCIHDEELVKRILNIGKEVVISCGAVKHWQLLPDYIQFRIPYYTSESKEVFYLYCISDYPTAISALQFEEKDFSGDSIFQDYEYNGFSDHTIGISASVCAMSLGAKIVEKHITLDKTMHGPDHGCSLELFELEQLCEIRNDVEKILY